MSLPTQMLLLYSKCAHYDWLSSINVIFQDDFRASSVAARLRTPSLKFTLTTCFFNIASEMFWVKGVSPRFTERLTTDNWGERERAPQ